MMESGIKHTKFNNKTSVWLIMSNTFLLMTAGSYNNRVISTVKANELFNISHENKARNVLWDICAKDRTIVKQLFKQIIVRFQNKIYTKLIIPRYRDVIHKLL